MAGATDGGRRYAAIRNDDPTGSSPSRGATLNVPHSTSPQGCHVNGDPDWALPGAAVVDDVVDDGAVTGPTAVPPDSPLPEHEGSTRHAANTSMLTTFPGVRTRQLYGRSNGRNQR
jgi:hypothetical protein